LFLLIHIGGDEGSIDNSKVKAASGYGVDRCSGWEYIKVRVRVVAMRLEAKLEE
jgi:hypothetical protein